MFDFLKIADVLDLHEESLKRYGGATGLREPGLLDSALASAPNTYFYAEGDVFDVTATYAFHLAESQCFFDGNKRTGIGAALLFLKLNGIPAHGTPAIESQLYTAMIAIAKHELDKPGLAALRRRVFQ
ncbi:MAG: type II toxin-antitoxin system death-on-curing family toxin [Luteolibacter sp.]